MIARQVQPFPWHSLEALTRADVVLGARVRRAARTHENGKLLTDALTELAGEPVRVTNMRARAGLSPAGADAVGVLFTFTDAKDLSQAALVGLEGPLAAALVARTLRQKAPRVTASSTAPSPELAGAIAAVLHAALRRLPTERAFRVAAAGPARVLGRDLAQASPDVVTVHLTVALGNDTFEAQITVPNASRAFDDASADSASRSNGARMNTFARLHDLPIALPLVVATALASRRDLVSLGEGDAFVPPKLALTRANDGFLHGPVTLVPPRAEKGLAADLAEGGRLVVRERVVDQAWDPAFYRARRSEEDMTEGSKASATVEVLDEAPVVVRVELGAVELSAREWADLGEGDVITLGRKLGSPAVLRVGGVEVARGELVQVDGEYGVRILSLRGSDS